MKNNKKKLKLGIIYTNKPVWTIDVIKIVLDKYISKVECIFVNITDMLEDSINNYKNYESLLLRDFDCILTGLDGARILDYLVDFNKNLTWVASISSGVEKFLFYDCVRQNENLVLTNSRGVYKDILAEYTIMTMLYFSYNVPLYIETKEIRGWVKPTNTSLYNKTVLLVGYGENAIEIAKRAKNAFNMKVIGIRKNLDKKSDFLDELYLLDKLREISCLCDFVVNFLPETEETVQIFDKEFFSMLKSGAVFINLGRGSAVNEDDLYDASKNNKIKAAALDVFSMFLLYNIIWLFKRVF